MNRIWCSRVFIPQQRIKTCVRFWTPTESKVFCTFYIYLVYSHLLLQYLPVYKDEHLICPIIIMSLSATLAHTPLSMRPLAVFCLCHVDPGQVDLRWLEWTHNDLFEFIARCMAGTSLAYCCLPWHHYYEQTSRILQNTCYIHVQNTLLIYIKVTMRSFKVFVKQSHDS